MNFQEKTSEGKLSSIHRKYRYPYRDNRIYLHYSRNLDNPSSISASLFNTRFDNIVTRCGKFRAANRDRAKPCTAHSCTRKPREIVPVKFEIPRRNVNRGESKMPIRRYYVTRPVLSCGHTETSTSSHCNQSPLHTRALSINLQTRTPLHARTRVYLANCPKPPRHTCARMHFDTGQYGVDRGI